MESQFDYLHAIRWLSLIHLVQQDPKPKSKKRQYLRLFVWYFACNCANVSVLSVILWFKKCKLWRNNREKCKYDVIQKSNCTDVLISKRGIHTDNAVFFSYIDTIKKQIQIEIYFFYLPYNVPVSMTYPAMCPLLVYSTIKGFSSL